MVMKSDVIYATNILNATLLNILKVTGRLQKGNNQLLLKDKGSMGSIFGPPEKQQMILFV